MGRNMEREFIIIIQGENIKVNGNTTGNMVMELLSMQMEISMKEIGKTDRETGKGFMNILMVTVMKDNGRMI